jgi:hypothetical protein
MATAAGFLTKAAIRREALVATPTWPGAAPAAADVLLPMLSHDVDERAAWSSHARLSPAVGRQAGTQRARRVTGPMSLEATYNGLAVLWALALGRQAYRIGGTDNPETLAAGAYQHTLEIDPAHHSHAWELGCGVELGDGVDVGQQLARRCTLAIDHQVSCWEFLSGMVNTFALSASPTDCTIEITWRGHSLDQASGTNGDLDAVTQPDWVPIQFHELEFRIGAYSDSAALDGDDAIAITEFRLEIDNHLEMRQTEASGLYPGEPKRTEPVTITGGFVAPRYEADTLKAWARANTALMASAVFTGPQIAATGEFYELAIWLPTITLTISNMDTGSADMQRQAFSFEATSPSAAAAGMPSVQDDESPLIVQVTDEDSTKPLWAA